MIRLRTLGTLDLIDSEGYRDVGGVIGQPMRAGVLAYLAVATPHGLHSRDKLMGLFWPESPEQRARHALNQTLYALRRDLGRSVITARGSEVGVDVAVLGSDARDFEALLDRGQLDEALELYTGDLLDGFLLPDRLEFDQWLEAERLRLRTRAIDAARRLGAIERTAGNLTGAAGWLRRAAAMAPFDEVILRELLDVLGDAGDRAGALRTYDRFVQLLEVELDVAPAQDTRALAERLRSDTTLSAASAPPPAPSLRAVTRTVGQPDALDPLRPRTTSRRLRAGVVAGAVLGLTAVAAIAWNGRPQPDPAHPFRVLVPAFRNETGDASLDAIGPMTADWISGALSRAGGIQVVPSLTALRSISGNSIADPGEWAARVADLASETESTIVVSGTYTRRGDTLAFNATIARPAAATALGVIGPVKAAADDPLAAVEELGRLATGSVAAFADENLANWVGAASRPPSLEAYEMFADGMSLFFHQTEPWRDIMRQAAERFRAAAAMDTAFTLPLVWAMQAYVELADEVSLDSVLQALESRRDALQPWDRAMADYYRAGIRRDRLGKYLAMQRVVQLAPSSEWRFRLGATALDLRRPAAAIRELTAMDPDRGWVSNWPYYWSVLRTARHLAGDYEGELSDAERELRRYPDTGAGPRLRALAGLGRVREVVSEVDRILNDADSHGMAGRIAFQAAMELHAHGHDAEYSVLIDKVARWFDRDSTNRIEGNGGRTTWAWSLFLTGQPERSEAVWRRVREEWPHEWDPLTGLALTSIARGDTAAAKGLEELLRAESDDWGESLFYQAAVAAHLGEADRAIQLLRRSWNDGLGYTVDRHIRPFLDPLRGNPAFEAIFRPVG